jgi:hypothetical protein
MKKVFVPKEYDMEVINHLNFNSYEKWLFFPILKILFLAFYFFKNLCCYYCMLSFLICGLHFFLKITSSTKSINIYEISTQHVINNELKGIFKKIMLLLLYAKFFDLWLNF